VLEAEIEDNFSIAGWFAFHTPRADASAQDPFEIQVYEYATVPRACGISRLISTMSDVH
jgi:hypothetical protein